MIVQRHDIIKRRLDSHGNVIESKQDGIGHTKVDFPKTLVLFFHFQVLFFYFIARIKKMLKLWFFVVIVYHQIEKPLQKHGGRLEHNETYCGSCFGAEAVNIFNSVE